MESVNPKNFIDIDPYIVSFITLKDGNMIMIDELTPAKPNKVKILSGTENNKNNNSELLNKEKAPELALSEQINFSFIGEPKNEESKTIIKKSDFNLISNISKNINFSFINNDKKIKKNNTNGNIPNNIQNNFNNNNNISSLNSSIDIKSSMFQSKRDKNNVNNILNEDNVNINLTDTIFSNQQNNNFNGKKIEEIMPSNIFAKNLTENNINKKNNNIREIDKIIKDNQKYTFDEKPKEDNINNINKNTKEKNNKNEQINKINNFNQINYDNINGNINIKNYNSPNKKTDKDEKSYINNPSLIIQNNNFYSQNNFQKNNINTNEPNINNETELTTQENRSKNKSKRYNRLNRLNQSKKDGNYVKAVVSINIPGEEEENINLVQQFNSLVDRLNGQKSQTQAREIIKRSERYYELYKNPNENILNSLISPEKNKKRLKYNVFFENNTNNNGKYGDNNISNSIYNNDMSYISYQKNNNFNSRILALKERSMISMNNSFANENNTKNIYKKNNNNPDIVLPSNFAFNKY